MACTTLGGDEGWVSVGDDADTAGFAVATIGRWRAQMGNARYPDATRLLVGAVAGVSNGYRVRAWKVERAKLAAETGLEITVVHYPPGTSKWNRIEHRLFSFITMNWRGRPLTSYRVMVELIANPTTRKGLNVRADLDQGHYPTGVKVANKRLAAVPIVPTNGTGTGLHSAPFGVVPERALTGPSAACDLRRPRPPPFFVVREPNIRRGTMLAGPLHQLDCGPHPAAGRAEATRRDESQLDGRARERCRWSEAGHQ